MKMMNNRFFDALSIAVLVVVAASIGAKAETPVTLTHATAQELPVSVSVQADYNPHWGVNGYAGKIGVVPVRGVELSVARETVGKLNYTSLGIKGVAKVSPAINIGVGVSRIPLGSPAVQRQIYGAIQVKLSEKTTATIGLQELYGKYTPEATLAYAVSPSLNLIGEYRDGGYGAGAAAEIGGLRAKVSYQKDFANSGVAASVGYQLRF